MCSATEKVHACVLQCHREGQCPVPGATENARVSSATNKVSAQCMHGATEKAHVSRATEKVSAHAVPGVRNATGLTRRQQSSIAENRRRRRG